MKSDIIAVLDFGGQYAHLIANRIRRLGVYSEIVPCDAPAASLKSYKGIILSGGPHSVLDQGSPACDSGLVDLNLPVLGLCYGHQLLAKILGGTVTKGKFREYGKASLLMEKTVPLFKGLSNTEQIWMSHGDAVDSLPQHFEVFGSTEDCATAAIGNVQKKMYGLQFHPEVTDTTRGMEILSNFIDICGCARTWNSEKFIETVTSEIQEKTKGKRVFLLVSGGVDSSVAFALLNQALGADRVLGLHIDNGLMRHNESAAIIDYMKEHGFNNLKIEDASERFLDALKGVTEPEKKRTIIGNMFLEVKEQASTRLGLNADEWILAQGTIYPDTIESAGTKHADRIKTHHNRVDAILEMIEKGQVIEPLSQLYKDEVRILGEKLGLSHALLWRHPFPGPGLGVRVLCSDGKPDHPSPVEVDKVQASARAEGFQAVILPIRSVGVQGDGRTYAHPALVTGEPDWEKLEALSTKITNTVRVVNRVIYGIRVRPSMQYKLIPATLTKHRLDKLRAIDHVVTEQLRKTGEYETIWQMPVVLLPLVNDQGKECVVLRPIVSQEAMTARFIPLRQETFTAISAAAEKIDGIGDLFFDITHKPPGTIEWE